ncbi:Gfo/Idh/MocA family oxidoreductase [Thalassotalea sp. 1_MG-2023]|uniref:Gfo/Idh/MocA family protein n=1 Tax=Thalassotalea sp. 1_MG-2023 TaxID=3062680 RepID=UPI0026E206D9|nr:Gfo/Idh/MocA family oxidoreductase [Thalassotalea sp. 1_MG-2023]MDO6425738.1 Gfo/Idh/MocA family oxidoreductase [Thalassotalea sp. 1_MG-2023]
MIRIATIGSNFITEQFLDAIEHTNLFDIAGIYSRSTEKAEALATKHNAKLVFNNLDELASCSEIDAVYIASPNSLHFEQSVQMLKAGKHVICEKPLAANFQHAKEMFKVAEENRVVLFEAFLTECLPNFKVVQHSLDNLGRITQAHFSYCQYSSRYSKYLEGENPNTFNPSFANGSIMDIGYYCVATAVALFGEPKSIKATANLLDSGVDSNGQVIFVYPNFSLVISHSKVSNSFVNSEVQGENGAIQVRNLSQMEQVLLCRKGELEIDLTEEQHNNTMYYEAIEFAKWVQSSEMDAGKVARSLSVARILTEIRHQTNVVFPSDNQMNIKKVLN